MKLKLKVATLVILSLMLKISGDTDMKAQSAKWAVKPIYQSISHYGNQTYKIKSDAKVGVINNNGCEILTAKYDSITEFKNGSALALTYKNGDYKVEAIINEATFKTVPVAGEYYLTKYTTFFEDKLCVKNAKGFQGFLGIDGQLIIDCKYLEVHPFSGGLASVILKNKKVIYIHEDGSPLIGIQPGEGVIFFGSTFKNGEAVVYARGATSLKGYYINNSGLALRDYNVSLDKVVVDDYDYSIYDSRNIAKESDNYKIVYNGPHTYINNGLYGYMDGSNVILPAQFSWAEGFNNGYAIVCHNAKYGILKLVNGSISGYLNGDTELKITNGKTEKFNYTVKLPEDWQNGNMELDFTDASGSHKEYSTSMTTGIQRSFPLTITVPNKKTSGNYNIVLSCEGLRLWNGTQSLTFSYGPSFSVSGPFPSSIKANPNDVCKGPSVTIKNNTNITQSVNVRIYGGPVKDVSKIINIPGNSSRSISTLAAGIKQTKKSRVYVEAGSFKLSKEITFIPFE